jgi:hypothetical protein
MKISKIQAPTSREHPTTKLQISVARCDYFGRLKLGCWSLALISVFSFQLSAFSQSYAINWHTIDGGGGTSTGGVYSVSGTIGQPDAGGPMTNGQYAVTGGFWALPTAVQMTNAPTLIIVPATPGNAMISWTPATPGFVLQETWSLSPTNWTNSPSGVTNPIVVPATLPTKFYRLFKP